MNRITQLATLTASALLFAAIFPVHAEKSSNPQPTNPKPQIFKNWLCAIDRPPQFSGQTTGKEFLTTNSIMSCKKAGKGWKIGQTCTVALDKATMADLKLDKNSKLFKQVPCQINARLCDPDLVPQILQTGKLFSKHQSRTLRLECGDTSDIPDAGK